MPQIELRCVRFNLLSFGEEVAKASGASGEATQVRYLPGYLGRHGLNIQTMLVESPYVDRHYIEEYSRYYATAFRSPSSSTVRIHFFTEEFNDEQLREWLTEAAGGDDQRRAVEAKVQASYRGYVVVRPLPSAPIGRSILAVYSDKDSRRFTTQPHRAHLFGLELIIEGVPFQQQEVAVGACATTAMWSALTIASRATGRRGPTPYQVTEAATRHVLNDRQIPADAGLDLQQILAAVRESGFSPLTLKAEVNFAAFTHSIKCYLASGIPVVLILVENGGYHAVTAVGFRSPDDEHRAADVMFQRDTARITTTGFTRIYVHDDRLGPYARMTWDVQRRPIVEGQEEHDLESNYPVLTLTHEPCPESGDRSRGEPAVVFAAVVPLYPKLRLTARGLLNVAGEFFPLVRMLVHSRDRDQLRVDLRFMLSGDYLAELLSAGLEDQRRVADFVRGASLPRYVGVVRFYIDSGAVMDVVCDTTDIFRDAPKYGSFLALFAFTTAYQEQLDKYAKHIR
jgi:hypothetical protein